MRRALDRGRGRGEAIGRPSSRSAFGTSGGRSLTDDSAISALSLLSARVADEVRALKESADTADGLDNVLFLEPGEEPKRTRLPTLLFRDDDRLVGVLMFDDSRPPEVCLLVHPDRRRLGIGRRLLEAARDICRVDGGRELILTLDEQSSSGRAFAEAAGARFRDGEYRLELEHVPADRAWHPRLAIRPATIDDLEAVVALLAGGFGDRVAGVRKREAERLRDPQQRAYIAEDAGRHVGIIRAGGRGDRVYVTSFAVVPDRRGQGLGRQILTRLVRQLSGEGWGAVMIEVATVNRGALELYRSCGFREIAAYGYYRLTWD